MAFNIEQLNDMILPELIDVAEGLNFFDHHSLNKQNLIYKILDKQALQPDNTQQNTTGPSPTQDVQNTAIDPHPVDNMNPVETGAEVAEVVKESAADPQKTPLK